MRTEVYLYPNKKWWQFWKSWQKKLLVRNIDYTLEGGVICLKKKMNGQIHVHYDYEG